MNNQMMKELYRARSATGMTLRDLRDRYIKSSDNIILYTYII